MYKNASWRPNARHFPRTNALENERKPYHSRAVPDKSPNDEMERLHRRREELKKQSEEIEEKLEKLQNELKKVTGRIVLPDDANRKPREGH